MVEVGWFNCVIGRSYWSLISDEGNPVFKVESKKDSIVSVFKVWSCSVSGAVGCNSSF